METSVRKEEKKERKKKKSIHGYRCGINLLWRASLAFGREAEGGRDRDRETESDSNT